MRPVVEEFSMQDLEALLARIQTQVSEDDRVLIEKLIYSYAYLSDAVTKDGAAIRELKRLLGKQNKASEKTRVVVGSAPPDSGSEAPKADDRKGGKQGQKNKRKGHGRNGADAYRGAKRVAVDHATLKAGDPCPTRWCKGILYKQNKPAVLIRLTGQAPINATVYELERLRCNTCGTIFTADAPAGIGSEKYGSSAQIPSAEWPLGPVIAGAW
jgi:hypothetical protein